MCVDQLSVRAQQQAVSSGGITADMYVHAVAPLLALSQGRAAGVAVRAAAVVDLLPLRSYGVAAVDKSSQSQQLQPVMDSPAARCCIDSLCLAFSHLFACDFFACVRVCRSWRAVRLYAAAWPNVVDAEVCAYLPLRQYRRVPKVQLYALRKLAELAREYPSHVYSVDWYRSLAQRLGTLDSEIQVRLHVARATLTCVLLLSAPKSRQ